MQTEQVRRDRSGSLVLCVSIAFAAVGLPQSFALAAPEHGTVVGGAATITSSGKTTTINQTSRKAAIDWRSFDIAADELVRFLQPGSSAVVLNKVTGDNPSQILGALQGNGHVWLINPNGIVFGPNAKVDVHGLVATTTDIRTDHFLDDVDGPQRFVFDTPSSKRDASIVNEGIINVGEHGYAVLSASRVSNEGVISASWGTVTLAGVPTMTLDLDGDRLINFAAAGSIAEAIHQGRSLVTNAGSISAEHGSVLLTGRAAGAVASAVINTSGIIEATGSGVDRDGRVVLSSGESGTVLVDGKGEDPAIRAGAVEFESFRLRVQQAVEASGDITVRTKYVTTRDRLTGDDVGILRANGLALASEAPVHHPTGGDVDVRTDVRKIAVGLINDGTASNPGNTSFNQLDVRNEGDLTITEVAGKSGILAHQVNLSTEGSLTLDPAARAGSNERKPTIEAIADGNAVVLETNRFVNRAGTKAISTPEGRTIVYSDSPTGDVRGGLGDRFVYDADSTRLPPERVPMPGDTFVYRYAPPTTVDTTRATQPTTVPPMGDASASDASRSIAQRLIAAPSMPADVDTGDLLFANDGNRELWGLASAR